MKTTTMVSFLLAATLIACTGGDDDATTGSGASAGTGASTPAPAASEGPEYNVSCQGEVSKKSVDVDVDGTSPRCVGGEPGTFCGDDPCAVQEVEVRYELPAHRCGSTTVFAWDGTACKGYPTQTEGGAMKCKGKGCATLYKSEAACKEARSSCIAK